MKSIIYLISLIFPLILFSQIEKFGEVEIKEFESDNKYKDADAVVLFKSRKTELEFQNLSGWTLVTTVHERIKINNSKGYDNATKRINYYIENNKNDELINVKAYTYNLKNNKINKTKLDNKKIIRIKKNSRWGELVFTMPNLQENSIIEWKYTIRSNYFYIIDDVVFQYDIPIKYFKAKISIIDHLKFKYWFTNKLDAKIDTKNGLTVEIKDVPALKNEPYVKNINLYRAKIVFEVFASDFPGDKHREYSKTWNDVIKTIYKDERFGKQLKKSNYYKEDLPIVLNGCKTKKDSIISIFNFVKDKVKWNNQRGKFTQKGVKKAFKEGNGNIAEINLILTSILKFIGINANPVLLSARDKIEPYFPTIEGFNYVICAVELADDILLLDASDKFSYIDILPYRALNGIGRLIREDDSSTFINLQPKNTVLVKRNLNIKIDDTGKISGNFRFLSTDVKSLQNRNKLSNLNDENLISHFEKLYNGIEINKIKLTNLNKLNKGFVVSGQFEYPELIENIENKMLVSPLFFLQEKETKLKSNTRKYPLDFGTAYKEITHVSITYPNNYKIINIPQDQVIYLENKQGVYSYSIKENNNKIIVKIVSFLSNPIVKVEDYSDFKKMISNIIQKESEYLILKKE